MKRSELVKQINIFINEHPENVFPDGDDLVDLIEQLGMMPVHTFNDGMDYLYEWEPEDE